MGGLPGGTRPRRLGFVKGNSFYHRTLAASWRIGAEFEIAGPFSIRMDGFALLSLAGRTFGGQWAALGAHQALMAGASVMGMWCFE
ncbi:MAG TPA: hypothetical protein PK156_44260 [Polyangium sp.]|nr:hypothetical protein [Polyangium sp.]